MESKNIRQLHAHKYHTKTTNFSMLYVKLSKLTLHSQELFQFPVQTVLEVNWPGLKQNCTGMFPFFSCHNIFLLFKTSFLDNNDSFHVLI